MASDNEACCESDPNFAVICGFLEKFGVTCGLTNIDFLDLQDMLENSQEVPQELVDLHVKLLRKARKSVSSERWERAIIKLCHGFCSQDAWEIERFGYKKARLSSKLRILKELLEMQFDYNAKFKNEINKLSAEELRTQPLGRDRVGHVYWFQSDNSCQIRVYKEDPDEETWALVAKDREGLVNLITHLNDGQVTVLNEDSNSLESEKPVVDTGQTDSNSNSNSSKQDQASTDTNTEENQVEADKKEESDSDKPQIDEEDDTQNNIEIAKPGKMRLRTKKALSSDDSSKTSESLGNGNGNGEGGEGVEQESKNETNSEKEEKDKISSLTPLTPPKTGISIRIKPISELISSSGVEVNKKPEITGVKEKYIRTDSSASSSVHHRKAVDSAGFDVHTNYLKRPIEEEEDVEEPSYIKRPRVDRPTLLGNKKKKPYSDEEDEEDEEVSDEVEEPLMLVTGEGSGQDNEGGNSGIPETDLQNPESDSPIVGEEVEESVVYFYGEGNGHECETGNENSPNKQDVASQQQRTTQNKTLDANSTSESSNPNPQHTSHESNKADTVDSIKDSEPCSSNDETDCSVKTPTKSEFKLGTIIDIRTNKLISCARDPAKKSRWDIGKPDEIFDIESRSTLAEETSEGANLQSLCNSNSDTKLESERDKREEPKIQKIEESHMDAPKSHKGKVQDLVNQWEKLSTTNEALKDKNQKEETTDTVGEATDESGSVTPKKSMFFFGPGCLQVKPTISPLKGNIFSEPSEKNTEEAQVSKAAGEDDEKIEEVPIMNSETQDYNNPASNLDLKTGSYEVTLKTEKLLESNVDSQLSTKEFKELKDSDSKKSQAQKSLLTNVDSHTDHDKQNVQSRDNLVLKDRSEEKLKSEDINQQQSSSKVLDKKVSHTNESKIKEVPSKRDETIPDNNLLSVKKDSKHTKQENIKSATSNNTEIQIKLAETKDSAKETLIPTVTDKFSKNNEEKVKGDLKKCDILKLSPVKEKSTVKQSETSTATVLKLESTTEQEKIDKSCSLPNNIVPANRHVPKSSVSEKELEKIDSSINRISDDQKDNKSSVVPVSEKSHVSDTPNEVESKKGISVTPKVAGLPVAEEQVKNSNTSALENKPKSKLEDVQEDIKKVNIQKTDSIDLSIKKRDSDFKAESHVTTSNQPCSIEMQMAMIMGEKLSDLPEITNAQISVSSSDSSAPSLEGKCLPDTKTIIENLKGSTSTIEKVTSLATHNTSAYSPSKSPSDTSKTLTISTVKKPILERSPDKGAKTQPISKSSEVSSSTKKIVLKRSTPKEVSSTNTPTSSTTVPESLKKPSDLTTKELNNVEIPATLSGLREESLANAEKATPSIKSSIEKVPAVASNVKKLDEKPSINLTEVKTSIKPVVDGNLPVSVEKSSNSSTDIVLPIAKSSKSGETSAVVPPSVTKKLDEKGSSNKVVSSISKSVSDPKLPIDLSATSEDKPVVKKLDDKQSPDSVKVTSSISKPISETKLPDTSKLSDGSGDAFPVVKSANVVKETPTIEPTEKKLSVKQMSDKVESGSSIPILDAKPARDGSDGASLIVKSANVIKEAPVIEPIEKKLSVKQSSEKVESASSKPALDAKPLVLVKKPSDSTTGVVSSTVNISNVQPLKESASGVKETIGDKAKGVDAGQKSDLDRVSMGKPSSDKFRIPDEHHAKKSSRAGVSSTTGQFTITEVIVSAMPSNVNKSRFDSGIISLTEILSTSEKVPISATKGGIGKSSTIKLPGPVAKEAPTIASNVSKRSVVKPRGSNDAVGNKSTDLKAPTISKVNTPAINKGSISDDKTLTDKKVSKVEANRESTLSINAVSSDISIKKPALSKPVVESTETSKKLSESSPKNTSAEVTKITPVVSNEMNKKLQSATPADKPTAKPTAPSPTISIELDKKVETATPMDIPSVKPTAPSTPAVTSELNKNLQAATATDKLPAKPTPPSIPAVSTELNKNLQAATATDKPSAKPTTPSTPAVTSELNKNVQTATATDKLSAKPTAPSIPVVSTELNKKLQTATATGKPSAKPTTPSTPGVSTELNKKLETAILTDKPSAKPIEPSTTAVSTDMNKQLETVVLTNKASVETKASTSTTVELSTPIVTVEVKKPTDSKDKPSAGKDSIEPILLKNKSSVPIEPILGKDKPSVEAKSSDKLSVSVEPVLGKDKPSVETKSLDKLMDKSLLVTKKSVEPALAKEKPSADTKSSDKLMDKSSVKSKKSVEPVLAKDKPLTEIKSSDKLMDKSSVESKKSAEPVLAKNKPLVETESSVKSLVSKDKSSVEVKSSAESTPSKVKPLMEIQSSVEPSKKTSSVETKASAVKPTILAVEVNQKSGDSSKAKVVDSKSLIEPALAKDKLSENSTKSTSSNNKTLVEVKSSIGPVTPKNKPSEKGKTRSAHSKNVPSVDTKVSVKPNEPTKDKAEGSIVEPCSTDVPTTNKSVGKESVTSTPIKSTDDDTTTNRRVTRRTRSSTIDKSEPTVDNKNEKSVNNKVSGSSKKAEVDSAKKSKKLTNEKSVDESETVNEKIEENEKPQKSDEPETTKGKGKQKKKKVSKENEDEEKSSENKKVNEPQVTGDTNRELRQRKVTEVNKTEEKKPRGRGRPKSKGSTVGTPKEEDKNVSRSHTRSQSLSVKDKDGSSKADFSKENAVDIGDIEEQIVRTEIRPSKKLRLSDSVEITVVEKNKRTVTTHAGEKTKESEKEVEQDDNKKEPPRTRRSLRSNQPSNTDSAGKSGKDPDKATSEPKEVSLGADKKEKSKKPLENLEKQELKPVEEPLCVEKKVPLLTCVDISKLKAPETSEEVKSTLNEKPIGSPESDDSCGFAGDAGDAGVDSDGGSSDDAVVIVPENDPLACSDDDVAERVPVPPPLTLATFKLDVDDSSPLPPMPRITRKRAAQQSVDALREIRTKGKKTQPEKKEEGDSKRPKLKKRSVDRNLRRSIEEQKLKAVSSSEEEDNNDDKNKSQPSVKQESGKKSKSIAKRRISTRSTRATESPAPSSDAPSEASRTDTSHTPPVTKEKKPRKMKKTLLGLEISEVAESLLKGDTPATVRQSRRIAQIKIKEEAERRKLEEVTLSDLKDEQRKRKGKKSEDKDYKIEKRKRNAKIVPTEDETTCDAESDEKKKRKRKRKHWDPSKKFDLFKAWKTSSGSSSSEIEDEEEEIEEDDDHQLVVKSDHEFSPESDLEEGGEVQPLKRARTARKESDAEEVDDCACQKCGQKDHPEWILLCDSCDCGWHCSCLRPALLVIPEGDWFCPPCQHITLVKNLEERLHEYDRKINKREMETRRKERLAYVGISLDNVLPSKELDEHRHKHRHEQGRDSVKEQESDESGSDESGSDSESSSSSDSDSEPVYQLRERRQAHSYRFNDYDELINSAIQDEIEAVKGAGNQGRGKDIATIVNAEKEEAEAQRLKNEAAAAAVGTDITSSDATDPAAAPTAPIDATAPPASDVAVAPEDAALEPLPPVVPPNYDAKPADDDSDNEIIRPVKKIIGKKKHRKLNSLDVSSGDDADSDEDFKGSSSSESEEDFDEYSGSESSETERRRGKRRKDFGPVRRSTRARVSRYDRDFINDTDSEDAEAPRRKKTRSVWDESESEESDQSWGRKKRKAANRSSRRKSSGKPKKSKKKKKKRRTGDDSDPEVYRKRPNIKFGGLNDDEEIGPRTRGKKINYLEALGTDSEEEIRRKPPRIEESEEEYNLHEDEDFKQQLANEKDSDESGVDTVLQDIAKNTQPRPKARGRGKAGLKIPRKPKDAPPPEFSSLMADLSQPLAEHPPMIDPITLQPLQPLQSLQQLQPLLAQPLMMEPSMMQEPELQDLEDEPNPIEQINKNVEQMNEQEMEKMMEEEDYANKQLQLVALQIEKEKKRKEREAKRLEKIMEKEQKIPKKRGRKPKNQMLGVNVDLVPPYGESASMLMNSVMANNAELSEPPGVSLPIFSEIAPVLNADGTPKKRRGRGKGKKTLAAEAAAIAASGKDDMDMGLEGHASSGSNTVSPAPDSPMHGSKLGIAAPPQPFSQSQPTPSVITRMLQSQPGQGSFPGGAKYFAGLPGDPQLGPPPGSGPYHPGASGPRGPMPGPYQQPPPGMPHYPVVRSGPAPPHRLHSPGPPGLPPMYHSHRSMDPSPSGGGPINVSNSNRDRHSPAIVPPASSSPLSKGDPTPPPPPYTRPQVGHFPPGAVSSAAGPRHVSMVPPHLQQHRGSNMSPYHPGVPPNYHYGSYPPPPLNTDEGQSPPVYPSPAYSEPYPGEGGAPVQPSEVSGNKPFDEETGGEFGGLVSYFSSQREDDLDT